MTTKLSLQDLDLSGKKVLMRVDFNVPMHKDGTIADDTRLRESLPSIKYILKEGGSVILMSHLGRPKGRDCHLSLKPCATALSQLLGQDVLMAEDCLGEGVEKLVRSLNQGQILLLENLRFYPAEEDPSVDPTFAQKLSRLADIYVNDAFATAHRAHSSTAVIAQYFPGKAAAGLLLQKEIHFFEHLIQSPKRPFYVIVGGAKISTKMGILKSLLQKVDGIFIGGGMAFTFFKAQGMPIGDSIHEDDQIPVALAFLKECSEKKIPLWFPTDLIIADAFSNEATSKTLSCAELDFVHFCTPPAGRDALMHNFNSREGLFKPIPEIKIAPEGIPIQQEGYKNVQSRAEGIPKGWQGMDIGPKTLEIWKQALQGVATLFWNGPLGVFEFPHFAEGTRQIAQMLSKLDATTVIGGGDSVAAINQMGLGSQFSHLSTGGGAALEYLEFGHLPGIDALSDKNAKSI